MSTLFVESKTARLTVLIDPAKKEAFEKLCAAQDLTPSQVVRQLIERVFAAARGDLGRSGPGPIRQGTMSAGRFPRAPCADSRPVMAL